MQDSKIWHFIQRQTAENNPVVLAIIVESKGSSPRKTGTKMVVTAQGELIGSVGGGSMEFAVAQKAKELLQKKDIQPIVLSYTHSDGAREDQSGMVCAGRQKVLLRLCTAHEQELFARLAALASSTQFQLTFTPQAIHLEKEVTGSVPFHFEMKNETEWFYTERPRLQNKVYLLGGGHVGLAVSRVLAPLDFYVHLIDNRPDFALVQENSWVDEKSIMDYSQAVEHIPEGENVFVLILTSNHGDDFLLLEKLIEKKLAYLGFLASKSKAQGFFHKLRKKGIPEEKIRQVSAPMGIQMNSHLPEEIAISIAAELLQVKNRTKTH
ncbi:MAG: XdhC family protein [Deferribacteres bacterium]|nr:XdhC family protein [candidate division KSB1 bacterium]MCB9503874.1 XdhC family protein [Deferribacteres bacterium]